jgi:integrase
MPDNIAGQQIGERAMPDYLSKRDGLWRYIRRVPKEFADLDKRKIIQHSTGVAVADDPRAVRARKVAYELNAALENHWRNLVAGQNAQAVRDFEAARLAARRLRLSEPADAAQRTIAELLERIEKLEGEIVKDRSARLAIFDAAPKPGVSFRECAERFMEAHKPGWSNETHAAQWAATLETYAYPVLGDIAVDKIGGNGDGTDLIMKVLQPIWYTRTVTATRLRGRIESVLDWAKARGYRDGENPARWRGHLDKLLPAKNKIAPVKHHPAMPYADVPAFVEKLRAIEGNAARALEFTVLTAARTSETLLAKRSEIDLKARMWIVPAKRMKARKDHRVPLCDRAIAILRKLPQDSDWVFPGAKEGKPLSHGAMLDLLRKMGGYSDDDTVHGFRSTFTDWVTETTDYKTEVRKMATAHAVSDETEAAYRRGDMLAKRHALMADWERYCGGG